MERMRWDQELPDTGAGPLGPVRVYTEVDDKDQSELHPIMAGLLANDPAVTHFFVRVPRPEECDLFLLPHLWGYYVFGKRIHEAEGLARKANALGKRIAVWHRGDIAPRFPFANHIVCQSALYRSRLRGNELAVPYFVDDPLARFAGGQQKLRPKREKPVVGFCGYAALQWVKIAYTVLVNTGHNLCPGRTPITILPAVLLRARLLRTLEADPRLETRFAARPRAFRHHDRSVDPLWREARINDFFENLFESDYALCVRGNGNWSIRFFEALAVGRIPVFIDTDCVLPDIGVDWKRLCVWAGRRDVARIADRILEYHASLSPAQFIARQEECRAVWKDRLSRAGFPRYLGQSLRAIDQPVQPAVTLRQPFPLSDCRTYR